MLASMDATQAIADLTEISPQVKDVVVIAADGSLTGSNLPDEEAAQRLADGARRLLDAAEALRPGVAQLEAATTSGSVFVVRDGERLIAARDHARADGRPRLLRPQDVPALDRTKPTKPKPRRRAPAKKKEEGEDAAT